RDLQLASRGQKAVAVHGIRVVPGGPGIYGGLLRSGAGEADLERRPAFRRGPEVTHHALAVAQLPPDPGRSARVRLHAACIGGASGAMTVRAPKSLPRGTPVP